MRARPPRAGLFAYALALGALQGCLYDVARFRNGDASADAPREAGFTDAVADATGDGAVALEAALGDAHTNDAGEDALARDTGRDEALGDANIDAVDDARDGARVEDTFVDGALSDVPDGALTDAPFVDVPCAPRWITEAGAPLEAGPPVCTPGETRHCYPDGTPGEGVGVCRGGLRACLSSGAWSTDCVGLVTPGASEICGNSQDDDCDGETDEGCEPACAMRPASCFASNEQQRGVGACRDGSTICTGMRAGACSVASATEHDRCGDGVDDDCDGFVDDGCEGFAVTTYTRVENPPGAAFEVDVCGDGSDAALASEGAPIDDGVALIPPPEATQRVPFALRYFGQRVAPVFLVSSNGWMSFGEDGSRGVEYGHPSALEGALGPQRPDFVIAPRWVDLQLGAQGVCYALRGAAPHRRFIIEWSEVEDLETSATGSLQVVLHEAADGQNNTIDLAYRLTGRRAFGGTTGIEDGRGVATTYARTLVDGLVLRFVPQPVCAR